MIGEDKKEFAITGEDPRGAPPPRIEEDQRR
jgi:hypothetical protein